MGFFGDLMAGIGKLDEVVKKAMENPFVDHMIDWAGDFLMMHPFRKNADGKRVVDKKWLRSEAASLFAKTNLDENLLRQITYSKHLNPAFRVFLFDNWGPDLTLNPATTNPAPSLGQIGQNQWDDIRLSLVEEMFTEGGPDLVPLQGAEKEAKIVELCAFLTELAKLPNAARLRRFVRIHYCKPRENDYKVVMFAQFRHRVFTSVAELYDEVTVWLGDPGPTGFRELARQVADRIDRSATDVRRGLDNVATDLYDYADRINEQTDRLGTLNLPAVNIPTVNIPWTRLTVGGGALRARRFRIPSLGRFIR